MLHSNKLRFGYFQCQRVEHHNRLLCSFFDLAAGAGGVEYKIERSLRFNSADSAYLNFTPGSAGDRIKWTTSFWVKRGTLGAVSTIFSAGADTSNETFIAFHSDDTLRFAQVDGGGTSIDLRTTRVFRDPLAWYHIVIYYDSAQGTNTNRVKIHINGGSAESSFGTATWPTSSLSSHINNNVAHSIGRRQAGADNYANFYLTHFHFINTLALDPSYFGQTLSEGSWGPKDYSGVYSTNGAFLKFSDNSNTTATTLGKDYSGNGNNWTPTNFSVAAGVGNDSLVDTPTNYGSDTGAGGEVRGNYCTLSVIDKSSTVTLTNGNLRSTGTNGTNAHHSVHGTFAMSSGKWYWEVHISGMGSEGTSINYLGIRIAGQTPGDVGIGWGYNTANALFVGGTGTGTAPTPTSGHIMGYAYDADNGKMWLRKNDGTWVSGDPAAGTSHNWAPTSGVPYVPAVSYYGTTVGIHEFNFGQRPFANAAPSGFKALCTQNLTAPTIRRGDDYFTTNTRTGTGASFSVTGKRFQPDLVWTKGRSGATDHALYDAVRGVQNRLEINTNDDEVTGDSTGVTAFNSDGFSGGALAQINTNTSTYVDWLWKEGATPGFDIVTYTGNGANRTIAHNLGVAPKFIIVKARTTAAADFNPIAYHAGVAADAQTDYLVVNLTAAAADLDTPWNDTAPTSSVFSVGTYDGTNKNSDTFVAYLWAEVAGFSKFGNYTGNGNADGPFVYCGFRPSFIMVKRIDNTESWIIHDAARNAYNEPGNWVYANLSNVEDAAANRIDLLSNGFKLRNAASGGNVSAGTYVFMAIAETPFKYARAR